MYRRLISIFVLFIAVDAYAAMPVNPSYVVQGASAYPTSACTEGDPCSLAYANTNAAAGDTVYLIDTGGIFTTAINPSNDGSSGNLITFQNYTGDSPEVKPGANTTCLELDSRSYVKVVGIKFTFTLSGSTSGYLLSLSTNSNHNELYNNTFDGGNTGSSVGPSGSVPGSVQIRSGTPGPQHNWIHGNTFTAIAWLLPTGCDDATTGMQTGNAFNVNGDHMTIEDNTFEFGGHHNLEVYTTHSIVRNNYFHNEGWLADPSTCTYLAEGGLYGNRNIQIYDSETRSALYNLIESNRFGKTGPPLDDDGGDNFTLASPGNIIRFNEMTDAQNTGILMKRPAANAKPDNNRIYRNTVYSVGRYDNRNGAGTYWSGASLRWYCSSGNYGLSNVIKNNIFYNNNCGGSYAAYCSSGGDFAYAFSCDESTVTSNNTVANNYLNNAGNPLFVDGTVPNSSSQSQPNLNLQSGSGAIDAGTYDTTVSSVTDTDTVVLADALYYQDGSLGSELAGHQADWICFTSGTSFGTSNCVQISAINYSTNTVDTSSVHGASAGWYVWLYKITDGTQVVYGSAPDQGAHESSGYTPAAGSATGGGGGSIVAGPAASGSVQAQ